MTPAQKAEIDRVLRAAAQVAVLAESVSVAVTMLRVSVANLESAAGRQPRRRNKLPTNVVEQHPPA